MALNTVGGEKTLLYWLATKRLLVASVGAGVVFLWLCTSISVIAVLGATIKNSGAILAVLTRLPDALTTLREERTRTTAERDAFEQFARRIAAIDQPTIEPGQPDTGDTRSGTVAMTLPRSESGPSSGDAIDSVQDVYRQTIMAVSHYEEEYDESLVENMAMEFGPEIAGAVSNGDEFTPQLQTALVQSSHQARKEREDLLELLETERRSAVDARRTLRDIHTRIDPIEESMHRRSARELIEGWKRLDGLEDTCTEVLAERQSQLYQTINGQTLRELHSYLYYTYPWTFPVLNDSLDCVTRLRETKRATIKALSKWR